MPTIKLKDGTSIPQIGLGLWQIRDSDIFQQAFSAALNAGYRHFDSAQEYHNEQLLGKAWRTSGLKRQELFLTTKISVRHFRPSSLKKSFEESLQKLQTDYVDLLLLHFPVPVLRKQAWRVLEELHAAKRARNIGVSNYTIRHLEEMQGYSQQEPAINQVELHVFLQQPELLTYCRKRHIAIEAYSPLAHARVMDDPVVQKIADKHHKTYAQILLRWLVEQQTVILPKSVTPSRIKENIEVFSFVLDEADRAALARQDKDLRTCWSPVHVP